MSQTRAGDLHAGAQSTRRRTAASTLGRRLVGDATDDVVKGPWLSVPGATERRGASDRRAFGTSIHGSG